MGMIGFVDHLALTNHVFHILKEVGAERKESI